MQLLETKVSIRRLHKFSRMISSLTCIMLFSTAEFTSVTVKELKENIEISSDVLVKYNHTLRLTA